VGACDGFGLTRRELLWQAGLWLGPKDERDPGRVRRQYELALAHPHEHLRFGGVDLSERLLAEYGVLGFAASAHPLSLLAGALPPGAVRSDRLGDHEHGQVLEVVGMVVARQRPQTAKGFVFILLEDEGGMSNVIVHPDVYDRYRLAIRGEPLLWIRGRLAKDDGTLNIIAEEVRALAPRRNGGMTERRNEDSFAGATAVPPFRRSADQPAFRFLKAMRTLAPDSKDWG
jgi:error-prone DNA polymerase